MSRPDVITFREWEKKSYGKDITEQQVRRIEEASNRLTGKAENSDKLHIFDFFRHDMRARNYVGVVSAGGTTVEILPKTHESDARSLAYLLALLGYTRKLRTNVGEAVDLGEHRGSFLEVWISYFASELNHLLRTSYRQRYVEIEERSSFVRGKLLTERDLDGRSNIYARYPCRYEIFTPDHLLNRALKFCNKLLIGQTISPNSRAILRQNDILLADVEDVPVLAKDLRRIHLDRLDREYDQILELCRLLLENSTLDLRAGRITQLAIVLDMNKLFEEFIVGFLRQNRENILIGGSPLEEVKTKQNLGALFGEFRMEVDIILHAGDQSFLLDTKYKVLGEEGNHNGLSQSDFYQMYAYLRAGASRYDGVILLYPKTEASPEDEVFVNPADEARLFVCTVDTVKCHDGRGNVGKGDVTRQLNAAFGRMGSARGVTA